MVTLCSGPELPSARLFQGGHLSRDPLTIALSDVLTSREARGYHRKEGGGAHKPCDNYFATVRKFQAFVVERILWKL